MTYATYELDGHRAVGEVHDDTLIPLSGLTELGAHTSTDVLARAPRRTADAIAVTAVRLLPPVPNPTKIICVATNYRDALANPDSALPDYPALFTKFATSLIGARDAVVLPPESYGVDFEGELAVITGRSGRRIPERDARHHILGYTVANDITMRDYQTKSHQWLQGKAWDASTPLGPYVVSPESVSDNAGIRTRRNGILVQESDLSQLIFAIPTLITLISTFTTLNPGDVILTGTPAGTGISHTPPRHLSAGDEITVEVDGVGAIHNLLEIEAIPRPREPHPQSDASPAQPEMTRFTPLPW